MSARMSKCPTCNEPIVWCVKKNQLRTPIVVNANSFYEFDRALGWTDYGEPMFDRDLGHTPHFTRYGAKCSKRVGAPTEVLQAEP